MCMRACVRWDFLLEHSGTRAAYPNVASHSHLLDHKKQYKGSNPGSSTCQLVTLAGGTPCYSFLIYKPGTAGVPAPQCCED